MKKRYFIRRWSLLAILCLPVVVCGQSLQKSGWPEINTETKPWTRWWWMGSAVDEPNLADLIREYARVGFGGLEITPIYGTVGYESRYLNYLSPEWMKMLDVSVREAARNGMKVDMNNGTGWPFGGPQIDAGSAASKLVIQKYSLKQGERLNQKLVPDDPKQADALLGAVVAFGPNGQSIDLTSQLETDNFINWKAPQGEWSVYAAFSGKTLQKVKRAAPGADGLTLDHFSASALDTYLSRFDTAFHQSNHGVRSFFNDSYEVYGTNWTPHFFDEFKKRRDYNLQSYLPELTEKNPSTDLARRVQCDYRETISDILLANFTQRWTKWANQNGSVTRNQAHGSPGNWLDLYAAVDIPECETFGSSYFPIPGLRRDSADVRNVDPDPIVMKFASSAAHVTGKKLVSSETFTWLAEHFRTSLSQCKPEVEQVFLAGVNHVFYHGTTYSPKDAAWPGWLFYASVNFAPSNTFWSHLSGLNNYITRCQSVLQTGVPSNDLLVYWPAYDVWMNPGENELMLTIHSIDKWLYPSAFYADVKEWMKQGYSLDFVSDHLLDNVTIENGKLITASGSSYKTLVIPACKYMPETTMNRIAMLVKQGAKVIFQQFPEDVPGLNKLESRRAGLQQLIRDFKLKPEDGTLHLSAFGNGMVMQCTQPEKAFERCGVEREKLVDSGLKYIRRETDSGTYYYVVNHSSEKIDAFLPFNELEKAYLLLDPQSGKTGLAQYRQEKGKAQVRLQLNSGEAMFVLASNQKSAVASWSYPEKRVSEKDLNGPWKLSFKDGGAVLPEPVELQKLVSWTELSSDAAQNFAGTGVYETNFELNDKILGEYLLDLGKVCESAHVWVNGQDAGIVWSIPFQLRIGHLLKQGTNILKIEVANLMANRIRQLDQQKVVWRNYHEINFVNIDYKPFDASVWAPMPSGLLGPVTLSHFSTK